MADIVVFNFLFITIAKLLPSLIKLIINIAESIKDVIVANFLPITLNKSSLLRATTI